MTFHVFPGSSEDGKPLPTFFGLPNPVRRMPKMYELFAKLPAALLSVENTDKRSDSVTTSTPNKIPQPLEVVSRGLSEAKALPLEFLLAPKPRIGLHERIMAHRILAEAKEPDPFYRSDHRIAWLTVKWAFEGVPDWCIYSRDPYVAATYVVLHCHPEQVWPRIVANRKSRLGSEYSLVYDAASNWRGEVPRKSVSSSPTGAKSEKDQIA